MRSREQNAAVGRKKKVVGDALEGWVEQQHEVALRLGILAHVVHNEPHAEMLGGKLVWTAATVADYTGVLDRCGRTLAVEAKSTTSDERVYRSVVSPRQQEHLAAVARAGGLALLVAEFRNEVRWTAGPVGGEAKPCSDSVYRRYAVPWLEVPWETLKSAESVSADALKEWLVVPGACYLARFHGGGAPSAPRRQRAYARE